MINKKGLSPLIATVLLVALVVVIAFLIFWWYGELIGDELEKSEITADQACVQDVSFRLSDGECTDGPTDDGLNSRMISFGVENDGEIRISSFRAVVVGDESTFNQEIAQGVEQGVSTRLSVVANIDELGTLLNLEIIPMISAGGTTKYCTEQSQFIEIQC
ncbi:hypothetical protein K8R33_02410 [archaeon]|nr:hypothetical protein [archaeon]